MDEVTIVLIFSANGGRGGGDGRRGGGDGGGGDDAAKDRPAGLFSLNYMLLYDMDVDFGSDKLRFFAQDHCPGGKLYWKAPGAVGTVPLQHRRWAASCR